MNLHMGQIARGPLPGLDWRRASIVLACTLGNAFGPGPLIGATFALFMLPVTTEFGWARTTYASVLTITAFLGLIAYPWAGRLADRFGCRKVALAGTCAVCLAVGSLSRISADPAWFFILFAVIGLVAGLSSMVVISKVAGSWFTERRGLVLGITSGCGTSLGWAMFPLLSHNLIDAFGWRGAYLGLALISFAVCFPLFWLFLREAPATQPAGDLADHTSEGAGLSAQQAYRTRGFWLLIIGLTIGVGAFQSFSSHEVAYAAGLGMPAMTAVYALMVGAAVNGLWQVALGYILDVTRSPRIAALMICVGMTGQAIMMLSTTSAHWIAAAAMRGVGTGTEYGVGPYAVQRYFGKKNYGQVFGTVYAAIIISQGMFPMLVALMYDTFGNYDLAFWSLIGMGLLCALLFSSLPDYDRIAALQRPASGRQPQAVRST